MLVKDLKKKIKNLPDDLEVFMRCAVNPCGNIMEVEKIEKSTYGFFGTDVKCIIINPEKHFWLKDV